ncbi:copper-binding protein [Massilia sp. H6]|uniref:copper-binding protein n=1 Tax=Massilia sp. H6 TaxID=2970464 RepID=UPI002167F846|nr:copper-binding protein [Massilia sp. H6]UVW27446.1 copper-binding protein [Massilia sp. H6]
MKIGYIVTGVAAASFALAAVNSALAQSHEHGAHAASGAAAQKTAMSEGEIKKVDKDTKRLTIKHGPLENLGMPGMTMVFGVKDASVLDTLKTGDKIKFFADKIEGRYVVTQLAVQEPSAAPHAGH